MVSAKTRKCAGCPKMVEAGSRTGFCRPCLEARTPNAQPRPVQEQIQEDRERAKQRVEQTAIQAKYNAALKTIDRQAKELETLVGLKAGVEELEITPQHGSGTNEATVVLVGSDWHFEEIVDAATVNQVNSHNPEISSERIVKFFGSGLRLTKLLQQDVKIENVVLALLGDFVSGDIHEEISEVCAMPPMQAIVEVQNRIIAGIEHFLNHSKVNLIIPCHSGNHARTTKTTRFATENGHSIEYLMYLHLAAYFKGEKRVKFDVAKGSQSYLPVYDTMVRFAHGHGGIRAKVGGLGGIYPGVYRGIDQMNKTRHADLDVFGHFHQQRDGRSFLANGSLIGYNTYAMSNACSFEEPMQTLALIDKKRGRTCSWPILFR